MIHQPRRILALALLGALTLAACGGDDADVPVPAGTVTDDSMVDDMTDDSMVDDMTDDSMVDDMTDDSMVEDMTDDMVEDSMVDDVTDAP